MQSILAGRFWGLRLERTLLPIHTFFRPPIAHPCGRPSVSIPLIIPSATPTCGAARATMHPVHRRTGTHLAH